MTFPVTLILEIPTRVADELLGVLAGKSFLSVDLQNWRRELSVQVFDAQQQGSLLEGLDD